MRDALIRAQDGGRPQRPAADNTVYTQAYGKHTCGEADIQASPDQPEQSQPQSTKAGNADHKLLVGEEVLGAVSVDCCLNKGIPWLCENLHIISNQPCQQ